MAFAVDALGKVIAYSYGTQGGASLLDTLRQLRLADASPGNPPSLNLLQAWASSSTVQQSLGKSQRTDYTYDVRGQLATQTQYTAVDSLGNGIVNAGTIVTTTVYNAQGRLLQTAAKTGPANASQVTTYSYDGLGRRVSSADPFGNVTSYLYDDQDNTLIVTQANGLVTRQVRNSVGEIVTLSRGSCI